MKILLGQEEVNPDRPDNGDRIPLLYAVEEGREGVVKILLVREEPTADMPDNRGSTQLSYAARVIHEGVVKILLRPEEISPDKPDNDGRTPLSYAAGVDVTFSLLVELRTFCIRVDMRFHLGRGGQATSGQVVAAEYHSRTLLRVDVRK